MNTRVSIFPHAILLQNTILVEKKVHEQPPCQWISLSSDTDILKVLKKFWIRREFHIIEQSVGIWRQRSGNGLCPWKVLQENPAHRITIPSSCPQLRPADEGLQKNQPSLPAEHPAFINIIRRTQSLISWRPLYAAHTKVSGIKRTRLVRFTCRSLPLITATPSSHAICSSHMLSSAFKSLGKKIINMNN